MGRAGTVLVALALAASAAALSVPGATSASFGTAETATPTGGPAMLVGVAADNFKQPTPAKSGEVTKLASSAGLDAIRPTMTWRPGQTKPTAEGLKDLENAVGAADASGIRAFVQVFPFGSSVTPLTSEAQAQFAEFAASIAKELPSVHDLIVGNEPNLNRFWLPQFNPDGSDAAAPAFLTLLEKTYDELKAVSPKITVWGLALSPHGSDNPALKRQTHSPTVFLQDLAAAYAASGRTRPVMDGLAIHPYPDNSSIPPTVAHPTSTSIGIADYGKLVSLLTESFAGTPMNGAKLPIVYDEYGIQTVIPSALAKYYTGEEQATTKPVSAAVQADYYRQAISLSFCQPNVAGFFIFQLVDQVPLSGWQSGLYYANDAPKVSQKDVRKAAMASHEGVIARCSGLQLRPRLTGFELPGSKTTFASLPRSLRLRCNIDCRFVLRLQRRPKNSTTFEWRGSAIGGIWKRVDLGKRRVAPASYRFQLVLWAPVNTGPVRTLVPARIRITG
jgi:hypothetical protein